MADTRADHISGSASKRAGAQAQSRHNLAQVSAISPHLRRQADGGGYILFLCYNTCMSREIHIVVIAVIRNTEGKYLLTLRTEEDPEDRFHNIWQLPGGGVEWGEKLEDALEREMMEEIGTKVTVKKLLPKIFESVRDESWHGVFPCYLCDLTNPHAEIKLNAEASDYKWYTPDEIKKLPSYSETIEVIDLAEQL